MFTVIFLHRFFSCGNLFFLSALKDRFLVERWKLSCVNSKSGLLGLSHQYLYKLLAWGYWAGNVGCDCRLVPCWVCDKNSFNQLSTVRTRLTLPGLS